MICLHTATGKLVRPAPKRTQAWSKMDQKLMVLLKRVTAQCTGSLMSGLAITNAAALNKGCQF